MNEDLYARALKRLDAMGNWYFPELRDLLRALLVERQGRTCNCRRLSLSEILGSALNGGCTEIIEECPGCAALRGFAGGEK